MAEAGSNLSLTRTHARSLKGTRARGTRPIKRGENVSTIAAITKEKVITLDNCPIHFSKEITRAITKKGAKIIYLPPYSPDFAPIENFWSKVKSILRKLQPRTYQELDIALAQAFKAVSKEDFHNWFTHFC